MLVDARVSFDVFYKEQAALSTIASFLRPDGSGELHAAIVGLLATAFIDAAGMGELADAVDEGPIKRSRSAWARHAELQTLLGITYKAIENVLAIAHNAKGGGLQVDAFALVAQLLSGNGEAQAEAVRCDVVALTKRKMAAGDDPIGQVAAAGCVANISTPQGLALMLECHLLEPLCAMLSSHAEQVKTASVVALAQLSAHHPLQQNLENRMVFESLVRLLYEPSPRLVAATLRAMVAFLKLGGKTEDHAARLRRYVASAVKHGVTDGVLDLGMHSAQHQELSLACIGYMTMSLKLSVPDAPKVSTDASVLERKKEDVLDRKSRRGLNGLTAISTNDAAKPTTPSELAPPGLLQGGAATASTTTSKPLVAPLLNSKTQFGHWMVCLLSTSSAAVHQAAMELMALSIDKKRDFLPEFSVPSVCWALTSVCARDERHESMRETALKRLVELVRLTTGSGSHLHNKIVVELAERFKVKFSRPLGCVEQVAQANKNTLDLDLQSAVKLLVSKNVDTLVHMQVLAWIGGMLSADRQATVLLTSTGAFLAATMTILKGDVAIYPLAYKTSALKVLTKTLIHVSSPSRWLMLHPVSEWRSEYVWPIALDTFTYLAHYLLGILNQERQRTSEEEAQRKAAHQTPDPSVPAATKPVVTHADKEAAVRKTSTNAASQELIIAVGYLLIGILHSNTPMQIAATRMGLCDKALYMLAEGESVGMRRMGADLLSAICHAAPTLSRLVLSLGQATEYMESMESSKARARHESFPRVLGAIFKVVQEMMPAAPPVLDNAVLAKLDEAVRQKKVEDFDKFATKMRRQEATRLACLQPLLISSLHTLLALAGANRRAPAAGSLDASWISVRTPLSFMQSDVGWRCWTNRTLFDVLALLVRHTSPSVVETVRVLWPVLVECQCIHAARALCCMVREG